MTSKEWRLTLGDDKRVEHLIADLAAAEEMSVNRFNQWQAAEERAEKLEAVVVEHAEKYTAAASAVLEGIALKAERDALRAEVEEARALASLHTDFGGSHITDTCPICIAMKRWRQQHGKAK